MLVPELDVVIKRMYYDKKWWPTFAESQHPDKIWIKDAEKVFKDFDAIDSANFAATGKNELGTCISVARALGKPEIAAVLNMQ